MHRYLITHFPGFHRRKPPEKFLNDASYEKIIRIFLPLLSAGLSWFPSFWIVKPIYDFSFMYHFLQVSLTFSRDVVSYLNLGGSTVGAQSAPSGWDRVNWSAKTWVGNCPPCPPISYAPVSSVWADWAPHFRHYDCEHALLCKHYSIQPSPMFLVLEWKWMCSLVD